MNNYIGIVLLSILPSGFFYSVGNATTIHYINDSIEYKFQNTYEIYSKGDTFSAYFSEYNSNYVPDTIFYLFDSSMRLVSWNDDGGVNYTSKISVSFIPQGTYYLTISHYNFWPLDQMGVMFELPSYVAEPYELHDFYQQHPISNINGPLTGYALLGHGICGLTSYKLALEGAVPAPEPSSALLLLTGLVGLCRMHHRQASRT